MNYLSDLKLLGKAFEEATEMEFDKELNDYKKYASFSPSHARRMREITGCRITSPITIKRFMIAIIAAVIFLVGCTAFIYREEISNFVVTHFSTHNVVESNVEETSTITVAYNLTYVPEGYTLVEEQSNELTIIKKYVNNVGNVIAFIQRTEKDTKYVFDTEHNEYYIENYNGKTIYLSESKERYALLWLEDNYSLYISLPSSIAKEEINKILDGVMPK